MLSLVPLIWLENNACGFLKGKPKEREHISLLGHIKNVWQPFLMPFNEILQWLQYHSNLKGITLSIWEQLRQGVVFEYNQIYKCCYIWIQPDL